MDAPSCTGCNTLIEEGSVIAFGDSLFHPACFKCAKCSQPVDCESNLLLLTTGKPVCEKCSYSCNVCKKTIRDEAIMTGEDAYHAECFKCVSCHKRIEDLVFTQTSKGIHCTPCHEKRKTDKQRRRKEREKRQKMISPLPSFSTPTTLSHRKSPGKPSDPLPPLSKINNILESTSTQSDKLPATSNPPTPSRSRSNSPDTPTVNDIQLTASKSEIITSKSPSSPPLSVKSSSPIQSNGFMGSLSPIITSIMEDTDAPIQSPSDKDTIDIPDFNLSFFENESTDLLNLTKTLGANITINIYGSDEDRSKAESVPAIVETTAKLTRASQILESSLSEVFSDNDEEFPFIQKESDREVQLTSELDKAHSKLLVLQSKYSKIKEASRQALDEFTNAKEEFSKEVILRQQQEHTITQLKHQLDILCKSKSMDRTEVAKITKTEIERIAKIRQELDKSCNDLKAYRNMLIQDIESLAQQKQSTFELDPTFHLREQQKALLIEISSLKLERDYIQDTTRDLQKTKEETLYEMVVLNTKNAELSEMNNALSRRVTEREREAVAVMAGTSFMFSPSASLSSELCSPVSNPRKSSEASIGNILDLNLSSPPKMFKLKKKNNMFAKLSGKSSKVDQSNSTVYGMTNASASAMNISNQSISHPHTKDRKYMNDSQQSAHTFQPTSFLRRTKCDACGDKIWGSTELRCAGCNYVSHTKCVSNVPQLCFGGNTNNSFELNPSDADLGRTSSGLFGSDLTLRAQAEERAIPWIIEACIEAVEIRGMDYEGIYRKTGGASQVRLIHRSFESGEPIDLTDDNVVNDICAVTSILKQYFRELPNPLLPFNLYTQFISTVSIHDIHEKSDRFFELLSQLPKVNYETLKFLIQHLNRVQQCHAENLMTTKNLAMVFGPSLMRDIESNRDLIDMSLKNAVIEYLIIHSSELFSL